MRLVQHDAGRATLRPTYFEMGGFFGVAGVGYSSLLVASGPIELKDIALSLALVAASGLLVLVSVRRERYSASDALASWLAIAAYVPLRHTTGGAATPFEPLVILPLLWSALFLRPRALAVTIGLLVLTFLGPLVLHPAARTPDSWRSAILWCCIAAFTAPAVHRLVGQLGDRSALLADSEARWRVVMDRLPDATVLVVDHDGRIDLVTGAGAMRQGLSGQVGRLISEVTGFNGPELGRLVAAAVAGEESKAEMNGSRSGEEHDIVVTPLPVADGDTLPHALLIARNVSHIREHQRALAHLADHDPLTGLANRRLFTIQLEQHVEFCRRYGPRGALLLLDLDRFKEVNDTLGHAAGDELLVSVGSLLTGAVRSSDIVARLGGDEFAVLLQETDLSGAESVAVTIVDAVRGHVSGLSGSPRNVTVSAGVVVLGGATKDAAALLADADMTMYDVKESGRDGYAVLDLGTDARTRTGTRLAWVSRMERALTDDLFVLHLQPVHDVRSGAMIGAEALLRLADGDELIYPGEFLPVAERSDLIVRIDQWVIRRCVGLLEEIQQITPGFRVGLNLSGRSIGRADIEETLHSALAEHQVDPRGLVFEITETVAIAQMDLARAFAERVQRLGCTFTLDDFGAGFGSFYYFKHLLFDTVKIDGEFVSQVHRNPVDRAIVRSIVGLAHGLGKKVVAEFVSDPEILEVIAEEGVDLAQGFLLGRPEPAEALIARLPRLVPAVEPVQR